MLSSDDDLEFESLETLRMDLEELKARGNQLRLEYRRELLHLNSEFEPLLHTLHSKTETKAESSIYHQVMDPQYSPEGEEKKDEGGFQEVEAEEEPQFTPFVRKIQSQLCGALHQVEVNQRQIKFAQRRNKRLIVYLSTEIEAQKAITRRRVQDFQQEYKEVESANQVMMDMLERDALDQEEIISALRLQLGMDPTPNSQRKYFRQRHKRRMQRLSGGLRNLGRRVKQAPKNIRDSKVWKDLVAAATNNEEGDDHLDASERRRSIMRRLRRRTDEAGESSPPTSTLPQEAKNRFHSSRVEKLSLEDIENDGRLGLVGRIRKSRQQRQANQSDMQRYLEQRVDDNGPLQGVRKRASEFRGLFKRQNSGKSLDSGASTEPPTPPTCDKALFPMDDEMFDAEIYALSI